MDRKKINPISLLFSRLLLATHPVGSLYWSMENNDPGTLFGGTWEQVKDQFVLAAGDTYKVGQTGGAASVTSGGSSAANTGGTAITTAQMPSHAHSVAQQDVRAVGDNANNVLNLGDTGSNSGWVASLGTSNKGRLSIVVPTHNTSNAGSGQTHTHTMAHTHSVNTMPPYTVAYCWRRTA